MTAGEKPRSVVLQGRTFVVSPAAAAESAVRVHWGIGDMTGWAVAHELMRDSEREKSVIPPPSSVR
jgi:hypothetical protein